MKKIFICIIFCFLCSSQTPASINKIEAKYSNNMKTSTSSSEMRDYTYKATKELDNEQKVLLKELANSLLEKEQNLLYINQQLWDKYIISSKKSTYDILHKQMGWIYQELAIGNLHSQALTRALTTYYLQKDSEIKPYEYLPKQLEECLQKANCEQDICKCFDIQKNIYENKILVLLKSNKSKITPSDYTKVLLTQQDWKNLVTNTKNSLFKIIDNQKTEKPNQKKSQILFMLYQDRCAELEDINFIATP